MKTHRILPFLFLALAGCGRATSVPPTGTAEEQADLKKMAGNWGISKIDILTDRPEPNDELKTMLLEVQGALGTAYSEDYPRYAVLKLDPAKSPKEIDFHESDKAGKRREIAVRPSTPGNPVHEKKPVEPILGIYKFDGDKVVLAVSAPGQPRPTEFKPVKIETNPIFKGVVVVTFDKLSAEEASKRNTKHRSAPTTASFRTTQPR